MPVATPILVRPGVEVKPVKGDSLRADWYRQKVRTDLAIEPVLVHAKVRRGIANSDEARY